MTDYRKQIDQTQQHLQVVIKTEREIEAKGVTVIGAVQYRDDRDGTE